jgi:hypothetical protein
MKKLILAFTCLLSVNPCQAREVPTGHQGTAEHNKAPIPLPLGCQASHTSALAGPILTALRRA